MDFIELVRQFRVGPFAVFDIAVSYLGIFLLAPRLTRLALKARLHISKAQWLWLVLPISIFVHLIFGLRTPLTKMVIDPNNYYLAKFVILFMLFMGLRSIKTTKK